MSVFKKIKKNSSNLNNQNLSSTLRESEALNLTKILRRRTNFLILHYTVTIRKDTSGLQAQLLRPSLIRIILSYKEKNR